MYTIKDRNQNKIQFKPNRAQEHFNANKHTRNIILKSRRLGFTTFEAIDMLDDTLFSPNFSGLIINYERGEAINIFKEKIQFAWMNFPDELKSLYRLDSEQSGRLTFDFGDKTVSSIAVAVSGRGGSNNRIHLTELGKMAKKYPSDAEEFVSGTIPSVPLSGRIDIESTAEGQQGLLYKMFWEAWNRKRDPFPTEFKAHFYNWTWDDDEMSKVITLIPVEDMEQSKVFKDYQKKYELTDQQITFYYLKWLGVNKDWNKMHQEYPTTPDEAFVGSGHHMFDSGKIENMMLRAKPGNVVDDWIFYEPYKEGHRYAAGVDVAEGVGQDSSTIVIMDFTEKIPTVVAEFESKKIPPDVLAYEVKRGCMKYGEAIAAVERNNHGHTTIATLKGVYPNLYTEIREDKVSDTITEKLGWITSGTSKPKMLYELKQAIDQDAIEIPSKYILEELKAYDKEDISVTKFKPDQSRHWDRVMALAICYQMAVFAFDEEAEITDHPIEQF